MRSMPIRFHVAVIGIGLNWDIGFLNFGLAYMRYNIIMIIDSLLYIS